MKAFLLAAVLFSSYTPPTFAQNDTYDVDYTTTSCSQRVDAVASDLRILWQYVVVERPSAARDTVYSAMDYANVYRELMRRVPGRFDRTMGVYMELEDRVYYMYRLGRSYPWQDRRTYAIIVQAVRNTNYLGDCYGRQLSDEE